jgi:hypothetical protein
VTNGINHSATEMVLLDSLQQNAHLVLTSNRSAFRHRSRKCRHNHLAPPHRDPYVRWCGRGQRMTAAPMPIKGTFPENSRHPSGRLQLQQFVPLKMRIDPLNRRHSNRHVLERTCPGTRFRSTSINSVSLLMAMATCRFRRRERAGVFPIEWRFGMDGTCERSNLGPSAGNLLASECRYTDPG